MQGLLRNDPHLFLNFPEIWQERFMIYPEMLNAYNENIILILEQNHWE